MEAAKIVLAGLVGAIVYGILHDQVTARVCVEYFTVAHPDLFATTDPTRLAFGWGIVATWWAGLAVGVAVALAARVGSLPKLAVRELWRPIMVLLLGMGVAAAVCGFLGYLWAESGKVAFPAVWLSEVASHRHTRFIAVATAHDASYTAGFGGGWTLCIWVWMHRRSLSRRVETSSVASS